jgi:DNA-binding Xre family transcriptional regulator
MTMRNRLKEVLEQRGKTPYWLAKETGISLTTAYSLVKTRKTPNEKVMNAICRALECQPGIWLEYVPDEN